MDNYMHLVILEFQMHIVCHFLKINQVFKSTWLLFSISKIPSDLDFLQSNYFEKNQIINATKIKFLEEFSDVETMIVRKMFLQLKFDILSEEDPKLEAFEKKDTKET